MKKESYKELCKEIAAKVAKNGTSSYSRTDLVSMTNTLINTPDTEVVVIVKSKDGTGPEDVTTTPVKRYRESLKPMLKQFGIDKTELDRVQDVTFSKEHSDAMIDLSLNIVKDYMLTGRKLKLPLTGKDESAMEISIVDIGEKINATNKIVKDETGKYASVPTGKTVKTVAHKSIKGSNKIPYWLKSEV
jgi:NACalpha-BTF3-like transcription factor